MSAAPMRYLPDGTVDWGDMWDSFCTLASDGGPPHRGELLDAPSALDATAPGYQFALAEIIRGVKAVSGLLAEAGPPGWVAIKCASPSMALWLCMAIKDENVAAQSDGALLLVPVAAHYTLKGEIKSVITVVAKTTHYWAIHITPEMKNAFNLLDRIERWEARLKSWLGTLRRKPITLSQRGSK